MPDKPVTYPLNTRIYAISPRGWRLIGCVLLPHDRVLQAIRWRQRLDVRYHPLDPPMPRTFETNTARLLGDDVIIDVEAWQ